MKDHLSSLLAAALEELAADLPDDFALPERVPVERARDLAHGDFASNVALMLAKGARRNPRELATAIVAALPASEWVEEVSIAGPGFINFRVTKNAFQQQLATILDEGDAYGRSDVGASERVLVEFVSANPTGPLHVGHGRHAAYGACVANLLDAIGYEVRREYYINDAGRQMDILAASVWLRYLEAVGETIAFPQAGYRGEYIREIAAGLVTETGERLRRPAAAAFAELPDDGPKEQADLHIDALIAATRSTLGAAEFRLVQDRALDAILGDIKDDLREFGVEFDEWFSERRLVDENLTQHALDKLHESEQTFERDGAVWFRASAYGDDKDRVLVRDNGLTTYIASDIAYHLSKRERGNSLLLDILGSDHHGYVARVRAGLEAMGEPGDSLEVRLVQFVSLYRDGQKAQMSTRSGQFVTLRTLRAEVGNDAARFFYVMRSNDQHLDFDIDLAKSRSSDNPVHYVRYAHARVCQVFRKLTADQQLQWDQELGLESLDRLGHQKEKQVMAALQRYPERVLQAARNRAPHTLVHYLRELAKEFHSWYNDDDCRILVDDPELRNARLTLSAAARQVIRNGLALLGVTAPESM